MKFFEVFKAGSYPQGKFTKSQIEELAKNYDPTFCEAPITLDHEQKGPAYGWVSELKAEGGKLKASFKDLSPELKDFVQSGKYKKISVEIYRNLEGKKPYLKAVSFLGASIPQVKGMDTVEFKEGDSDVYEFEAEVSEDDELRFDSETEALKARISELEGEVSAFKESNKKTETIKSLKAKITSLSDELATFKEQASDKEELEQELNKIKASVKQKEFDDFIDRQIEKGTLIPANKDLVLSVLSELDNLQKFGEEADVIKDFKSFIESLPKQIEFDELATKNKVTTKTEQGAKFANANEESLAIFNDATALAEKDNITFKEALLKLNI